PTRELSPLASCSLTPRRPISPLFPTRRSSDLAVILQRPGNVIVPLRLDGGRAVGVPAVAHVPAVDLVQVPLHLGQVAGHTHRVQDRKSTRLNSSHVSSSYAVFCLKKKTHATTP